MAQVRLRSADLHDPPLIDPKYLTEEEDVETMLAAIRCGLGVGTLGQIRGVVLVCQVLNFPII